MGRPPTFQALDAVGVDGALRQPAGVGDFARLGVEHFHEVAADDLALLLGVADAFQVLEELLAGIHADDIQAQALIVVHHVVELVLAQQAVVHENAGQVLADGAVQQHGGHGRIHAPAQAEDDAVVANLLLQLGHRSIHERGGAPRLVESADVRHEVAQHQRAVFAMEHLGMELHAPHLLALHLVGGDGHLVRRGDDAEVVRDGGDGVAVAHPHLRVFAHALQQGIVVLEAAQIRTSVLAAAGGFHLAPVGIGDELRAIADAQDGQLAADAVQVHLERLLVIHREGASGQDDALHAPVAVGELVVRHDFAIHIQLADAAADELRGLRTEVENDNLFLHINQ